jgi:hypothetical protein
MIEMHVVTSDPLYNAESRSRWFTYPSVTYPSYYYGWVIPDGNIHGTTTFSTYQAMILNRMNIPSPIRIIMRGNYNQPANSGTISASYYNESGSTINGNVLFVITEDSLYYSAPNGDQLHNHVARDYIPNYIGSSVSIPSNDSVVVTYPFTTSSDWNPRRVAIVTWIQNPNMASDSTKEVYQGARITLMNLNWIGVEEEQSNLLNTPFQVNVTPNPCVNRTSFAFSLSAGTQYTISIFDAVGRNVKTLTGIATGKNDLVQWHPEVRAGIYLYRFESNVTNTSGKIIVK